jgi:hypothetical protein
MCVCVWHHHVHQIMARACVACRVCDNAVNIAVLGINNGPVHKRDVMRPHVCVLHLIMCGKTSLEHVLLAAYLTTQVNIAVSGINIGPVHKRDVMRLRHHVRR